MRIPFPIKVFFALLAVVVAGALPTYIYIETSFVDQLTTARVDETAHRAALVAESLRPLDRNARLAHLREEARTRLERITYIGPTGVVLFDSVAGDEKMGDHSARPEVARALGRDASEGIEVGGTGVGAARRTSTTTGIPSIYVAVRIDDSGEVVRLAFPAGEVTDLADRLRTVFRNSQALALSVALLLSVLAAFVFMRPLQRLARSASAISHGDYTASEKWRGSDEIGDVGQALNSMAMELRLRLANAQASETLLVQAAEFLEVPIAMLGADGTVHIVNGAFRRAIEDPETDAEDVLARLVGSNKYARALDRAKLGENCEVMDWTRKKIGVVLELHTLQRPASEPLVLLTTHRPEEPTLPTAADAKPIAIETLLEAAIDRARPRTAGCQILLDFVDATTPQAPVVEAEQRAELAIAVFIEAAARGQQTLRLCIADAGVGVDLWLDGEPTQTSLRLVRMLLEPLGGSVEVSDTITLHLPRA